MTRRGGGNRGQQGGQYFVYNRETGQGDGEDTSTRQPTNHNLDDIVEQMLESRYSTREGALRDLSHNLAGEYQYDAVDSLRLTIAEGLRKSFKKGRDTEQRLAAQALGIVVLTLGADSEDMYNEFEPFLVRAIEDGIDGSESNYSPEARADFIEALALLSFIASTDSADTKKHMELFERFFGRDHRSKSVSIPQMQEHAVKGWTLLSTTLDSKYVIDVPIHQHAAAIAALLDSGDVDVRLAAGEAIALIFSMLYDDEAEEDDIVDGGVDGEGSYDVYKLGDRLDGLDVDELLDRLKDLSAAKERQRSKKEILKQKGRFKEIARSVELADFPSEVLVIDGQRIHFDGWRQLVQLNVIRDHLAGGMQDHLENNDLLSEIFDYHIQKGLPQARRSKVEKRLTISSNSAVSKARSRNRKGDRQRSAFSRTGGNFEEAD